MRLYLQRHRFGSASAADLIAALAESAQRPELPAAFDTFLEQPGVPLVTLSKTCSAEGVSLSLRQSRYAQVGSNLPPHVPVAGAGLRAHRERKGQRGALHAAARRDHELQARRRRVPGLGAAQ